MKGKIDFLSAGKRQMIPQIDTITLSVVARHTQITQNNEFDISWQYLKKEVSN